MQNVSNVFRIAFIIKSCIKSFSTAKNEKTKNFHTYGIRMAIYEGENETYIEASAENSGSTLYDKEIRDKPRTRHTKRNV